MKIETYTKEQRHEIYKRALSECCFCLENNTNFFICNYIRFITKPYINLDYFPEIKKHETDISDYLKINFGWFPINKIDNGIKTTKQATIKRIEILKQAIEETK